MKRILAGCFAAVLVLFAAGCEKVIEFKGEMTKPRLTLSSYAEVGEPLTVYVASSIFFLSDQKSGRAFTESLDTLRGSVRCYVNGATTPRTLQLRREGDDSSLCYRDEGYVPEPGDHIRLEAEFPGFDPVWAETDVPRKPVLEVVSARLIEMKLDLGGLFDDEVYYDLEVTLAVTDDASYDKYYYLQPVACLKDEWTSENWWVTYNFTSNDVIFRQMSGSNALSLFAEQGGSYFSDELIKGQRHQFTITISDAPFEETEFLYFGLCAATVDESLFWFDQSYTQSLLSLGGLFAEGVTLYSNVEGGYGFFGAAYPILLDVEY